MSPPQVVVIGAGIVGVTSSLALRRRGYSVTLIDRKPPGRETSYGNAGILSDASVILVNNPTLLRRLPTLLLNTNTSLQYNLGFAIFRLPWIIKFLMFSSRQHMYRAGIVLRDLQVLSLKRHKALIREAEVEHLLRDTGWLKLYRSKRVFDQSREELSFLQKMGVAFSSCSTEQLRELEPALKPVFYRGILMRDTCSVLSPGALTEAYSKLFIADGGRCKQAEVKTIVKTITARPGEAWQIEMTGGEKIVADDVVIAAGPWSAEICKQLGYTIPMAWERGYHIHLASKEGAVKPLRPIQDVEGGFVVAPQQQGIRVLTGVELTHRDAPPNHRQIRAAEAGAREMLDLGDRLDAQPWLGCRPTLPDSLPMIGAATKHKGLWFNFGHQHIGLSTSTGCAGILADLMQNKQPAIDPTAFSPGRFRI